MTAAHSPGGAGAEVVVLRPGDVARRPVDLVKAPPAGGGLAQWLDRPVVASRQDLAREFRWRTRATWRAGLWVGAHAHLLAWREVAPIRHGLADLARAWRHWQRCGDDQDRIDAMGDRDAAAKLSAGLRPSRARRFWGSAIGALAVAGAGWWATTEQGVVVPVLAVFAMVVVADVLGRRTHPTDDILVPPPMPILVADPDVPLSQLQLAILEVFEREGFAPGAVGVAHPLRYDPSRQEYRMTVSCPDEIRPQHLRAVERAIGAPDFAVRCLATDTATNRVVVIRAGDPLAVLAERPFVPTGSRSIVEPVSLGDSTTEVPFAIPFAGVHVRIVMGTGGGKTKWVLRSAIDGLSACRDCVLGGIDITNGPELSLWRDVIQHRGLNVEDAERVLDLALAEIDRRGQILAAIAEDDDPTNDADEWHAGLGHALVIFVDEFAQLAVFDGKGGKPNLLGKCEQIVRTGRKHWVSLVMLTQKTGNDDFGSTTMSTQCAVSIAGPCDPADAVRMFGVERRDAGYTPHLLAPGVEGDIRDAGKVFIDSPMHRSADLYRAYAPGTTAEVKRRARQRMTDGLPTLTGGTTMDAVEVPEVLAFLARAFADRKTGELRTAELVEMSGGRWSDASLSAVAKVYAVGPRKLTGGRSRGYHRSDVDTAIEGLS